MKKITKLKLIFFLQLSVIIYTCSGICSKYAANYDVMSLKFIGIYALEVVILGIYAIIWQQLIKKIDLSIAYANKGTALIWTAIWAVFLFNETISICNIIGIITIMVGIYLINSGDIVTSNKEDEA